MSKYKGKLKGEALRSFQRGKYGPSRKPAPVVIRDLETDEIVAEVGPWSFADKKRKKR